VAVGGGAERRDACEPTETRGIIPGRQEREKEEDTVNERERERERERGWERERDGVH
jgi:hypothetical protein